NQELSRVRFYTPRASQLLAVDNREFEPNDPDAYGTIWTVEDYQGSILGHYVSTNAYERSKYDLFGAPESAPGNLSQRAGVAYMGLEYDAETELYVQAGRPYVPSGGRYLTAANFRNGVTGAYAFANNTPADRSTGAISKTLNSTSAPSWDVFVQEFSNEVDVSSQWARGNHGKAILYGVGQTLAAIGTAGLGIVGGATLAGGTTAAYALSRIGAAAGITSNSVGTYLSSNGQAGFSQYALAVGIGGATGGLSPTGGLTSLGGGVAGASIAAVVGGDVSAGFQVGDIAGGVLGGGIDDFGRALAKGGSRLSAFGHAARYVGVEGGATLAGAGVGYAATGTFDGALLGASFGQVGGGLAAAKFVKCFVAGTPVWVPVEVGELEPRLAFVGPFDAIEKKDSRWSWRTSVGAGLLMAGVAGWMAAEGVYQRRRRKQQPAVPQDAVFGEGFQWSQDDPFGIEELARGLVDATSRDFDPRKLAWQ
ncbi:MAG: hypothetical protein MI861_16880, partial [Pirellulales bacterium]|nr:hypothetical protein [Pirellulales bacterium]